MFNERATAFSSTAENDLRRQIDRCVGRALVDGDYAMDLLSDPTLIVRKHGCPPQHYKSLRNIHASDLLDFARQAYALFWFPEAQDPAGIGDARPLVLTG